MRAFFQPFRRKLGILVLAFACALMSLWVRSNDVSYNAKVQIPLIGSLTFHSHHGKVYYSSYLMIGSRGAWEGSWETTRLGTFAEDQPKMLTVPYAAIVIPLTLLAAWLMLSKPRLPKQTCELH